MSDPYLNAINKGRGVPRGADPLLKALNKGGSVGPPRTPSIPLNPATGRMGSMAASPADSLATKVLNMLKSAGRFSPYLIAVAGIVAVGAADEFAMAEAASTWKFGISARLDDGVKNLMPQILPPPRTAGSPRTRRSSRGCRRSSTRRSGRCATPSARSAG
jgi:hypothetical protein